MDTIDRFHKTQSTNKFPLEHLSKKILKKKSTKTKDPSDHLLNFILNKSKQKKQKVTVPKMESKQCLFTSSPRMRPFSEKTGHSGSSNILVDKYQHTIDLSGVSNDFYSHMVDSVSENFIAFGLFHQFLLYDLTEEIFFCPIANYTQNHLTALASISVNPCKSETVALGNVNGTISLVNLKKQTLNKHIKTHFLRVGSIKFHPIKPYLMASGSKDHMVSVTDLRSKRLNSPLLSYSHMGEICGLTWQNSGYCLASGGNDNKIQIWDLRKNSRPLMVIKEHSAAVRALEFSPMDDDLLASGGGTGDSSLRVTSLKGQGKNSVVLKTQSQICSLLWDTQCNRLLTSHGFSKYQLCLWNLEREKLVTEYYGHTNRILDIVRMKNSNQVLSFSPDNTAKLWNPFKAPIKSRNNLFTPIKIR
jgi:cell division cycle 20-like protein 1 (cofactor of APC complex)